MRALSDLLRETAATLGILFLATFAMHGLLRLAPRDPAAPAEVSGGARIPSEPLREGDPGFLIAYATWAGSALRGDWGMSQVGEPVGGILREAFPITLGLLLLGLAGSTALSTAFAWSVTRRGARAARVLSGVLGSVSLVPVYLLAFTAATLLESPDRREAPGLGEAVLLAGVLGALLAVANGVYTESVGSVASTMRHELGEPYVRSLVARRIPLFRHVLRNVSPVILGLAASHIPRLLTAVFILEWAFNLPGLGNAGLQAFDVGGRRDANLIMAVTVASALLVRLLLGLSRAAAARLAPRTRAEA